MAKGQAQAANKQLKTTNQIGSNELNESNKLMDQIVPGYTSLMNTGYVTPGEEEAAVSSGMGAATTPFAATDFAARNRAAATRNPADLTAQEDTLALEKGQAAGGEANALQEQKMANQEAGMYGLNALQNEQLNAGTSMYGLGPGTLSARAQGQNPLLQIAGDVLGAAGTAASGPK